MASKYDAFWLGIRNAIATLIEEAVTNGKSATLDVSAIKKLGNRASWHGQVYSRRNFAFKSEMAHADALRSLLNDQRMLAYSSCDLRFTISKDAKLLVVQTNDKLNTRSPLLAPEKVLFCNIGWMKFYQGIPPDKSDRIEGGGRYVDEHGYGFEILNFRPFAGKLYGYVQPVAKNDFEDGSIRIERLGASADDEMVDGVTIIFVSKSPHSKRRRIVGWYKNATVYRKRQIPPKGSERTYRGEELGYYITTTDGNQTLLTESVRDQIGIEIPTGKGGMGRSNVWFAADRAEQPIVEKVLSFIGGAANDDDSDESLFQAQVQTAEARDLPSGPIQKPSSNDVSGRVWKRDPRIAKNALVEADFSCMLDPTHKTFTSRATGKNYVEAHHLVPMVLQDKFDVSLDAPGNVVALCPNCHRLLHQGEESQTGEPISILFKKREAALGEHGIVISLEELLKIY
ncbi:MAG: HNH endonuclease [Candidatus Zixiibacteriota bacterium]